MHLIQQILFVLITIIAVWLFSKKVGQIRRNILSKEVAEKKLLRMAYEIVERNPDETAIILAGIRENGVVIAARIGDMLSKIFQGSISILEISMDKKNPGEIVIEPVTDLNDKTVILVDDVANTGRTLLYALKPLLQFRPKKIQTLVLVERTHKTFPVSSDYVGLSISTTLQEHITVEVMGEEVVGAYLG